MSAEAGGSGSLLLLSGVNLGLLGERQPEVYGTATLEDHVELADDRRGAGPGARARAERLRVRHGRRGARRGAGTTRSVVNPGAFTHYSWALHDALAAFEGPVVELHLSNPQSRERWRHTSVVTPVADAMVCGLGGAGYRLAVDAAAELLRQRSGR